MNIEYYYYCTYPKILLLPFVASESAVFIFLKSKDYGNFIALTFWTIWKT